VTTLLNPARVVHLSKRHSHEIKRTPGQMIPAFVGSGVHRMFEESLKLQTAIDNRYDIERTVFDKIEDRLITGTFDILYDSKHLYDIKTCKVWKVIFDPHMVEWTQQQNIYALLLHRRGFDIKSINILAIYLDWKQKEALFKPEYPQESVVEYKLKLWPWEETEGFLAARIKLMKDFEDTPDDDLMFCTDDEMWVRNTEVKYALFTSSEAGRAKKIYSTLDEAMNAALNDKKIIPGVSFIEVREPSRTRCVDWCAVAPFCNQYKEWCGKKQNGVEFERIIL
jgi:hypothetical protein